MIARVRPYNNVPKAGGSRGRGGFTLLEVVISLGLLTVIMGAFAVALNNSSDSLMTGFARGVTASQLNQVMKNLQDDLQETAADAVDHTTADLPGGQCALLFPTARDSSGIFHVSSTGRPVWQGVVVYCPFVNTAGSSQVRRYVYYPTPAQSFPFTFEANPITDTEIRLRPLAGGTVTINRADGNADLPVGQRYTTFCSALTGFQVAVGSTVSATVQTQCNARGRAIVAAQETAYVAPRN